MKVIVDPATTVGEPAGVIVALPIEPESEAVTEKARGAEQLALVPTPVAAQVQVRLVAPVVIVLAAPTAQRFALGSIKAGTPLALPHAPLATCSKLADTVQSAVTASPDAWPPAPGSALRGGVVQSAERRNIP